VSESPGQTMKFTIYEDPATHQFGYLPLPSRFVEGDPLPPIVIVRWFESHHAAVAALSDLLAEPFRDVAQPH
jgi:hypothetical protein